MIPIQLFPIAKGNGKEALYDSYS